MMRQKELGIWRAYSWNEVVDDVARDRRRPGQPGLRAGRGGLDAVQHLPSNGCWCDLAVQSVRRRVQRHLPHRCRAAGATTCAATRAACSCSSRTTSNSTSTWRSPTACRWLRGSSSSTWKACATFDDPRVISLDAVARTRAASTAPASATAGTSAAARAARRPGDPGLHLGHHRPAQGRDDQPGQHLRGAGRGCRPRCTKACRAAASACAFLPLCHIAERMIGEFFRSTPARCSTSSRTPRRCSRTCARCAPTVFFAVPRVWEKFYSQVTIGLSEADKLQQAAYAWAHRRGHARWRSACSQASRPSAALKLHYTLARWLVLDNVRA